MALYPEVQKKAQAEIDTVVGPNRLPDFQDRPSLPYINAIVKELMRWNLVAPLGRCFLPLHDYYHPWQSEGVPHMSTNDDEYNGYYIPKGTLVIGNAWSLLTLTPIFFCPDSLILGQFCMTPRFSTTPWNSNLPGIWKMVNLISLWETRNVPHLDLDVGQ